MLKDGLIRDRIICGLWDKKLRKRLLREHALDLDNCSKICRAAELAEMQTKQLTKEVHVHAIKKPTYKIEKQNVKKKDMNQTKVQICTCCGMKHEIKRSQAFRKMRTNCRHYNHFTKMCHLQKIHRIETDNKEEEHLNEQQTYNLFVGIVQAYHEVGTICQEWTHSLIINGESINFKLDTGAQLIMNKKIAEKLKLCIKPSSLKF